MASDHPPDTMLSVSGYPVVSLLSLASFTWHRPGQDMDQALRTEHSAPLLVLTPVPPPDPSLTPTPSARGWADGTRGRAAFLLSTVWHLFLSRGRPLAAPPSWCRLCGRRWSPL